MVRGSLVVSRLVASQALAFFVALSIHAQTGDTLAPRILSITGPSISPILQWNATTGAIRYELQLAHDAGFTAMALDDTAIVDTIRIVDSLKPDTGYYARVNALTPGGATGWSNVVRFYAEGENNVFTFFLPAGWNMVSLPIQVSAAVMNFLFPSPCNPPAAFCYSGGYTCCPGYVQHSYGFWIKSASSQVMGVTGVPLAADTVDLVKGWNLIGSIFTEVATASVTLNPPTVRIGNFFGYSPWAGGYVIASRIAPFNAYWVKSDGVGQLIISSTAQLQSRIFAYVHWQEQPVAGKKVVVVETGDTAFTDSHGLATFEIQPGTYTLKAFDINRGGPALQSVEFEVVTRPGEISTVDIIDCLPCF